MDKITHQTHPKEAFLYAFSRILERLAYYGLRSLIVLYMVSEVLKMEDTEALTIYGFFTASIMFSQIIGAVLGDLLIGNRNAVIVGGIIQSLGAFTLCIPSTAGLYTGLFLVVLGGGLYTPNLISNFGKLYLDKTKLLDSGFTIFYFAVNIGAFLGAFSIGLIGDKFGWNIGFILAGIIILLSIIPVVISGNVQIKPNIENRPALSRRIINILIALVSVGLFWAIYESGSIRGYDLQLQLSELTIGIPKSLWSSLSSMFIVPISLFAIILWTYFYSTQFFKLAIGFIFGTISFGILLLIPESPNEQHIALYLISLLCLGVAEIHIAPIIYSILTQYANPKFLAILISLTLVSIRLFTSILAIFSESLHVNPNTVLLSGVITMTILGIGLLIYKQTNKELPETSN